jgi:hypothetical protein
MTAVQLVSEPQKASMFSSARDEVDSCSARLFAG